MSDSATHAAPPRRLMFLDALRAVVATLVTWHHFERYGPLWAWADPQPGPLARLVQECNWAIQVFFIISGFVLAMGMSPRRWSLVEATRFLLRRYVRLGFPYLAAIAMAIGAAALARGWLSDEVLGAPPSVDQVLAHAFYLQDILGYPALSAGLWFVAIEFQLSLMYLAVLLARELVERIGKLDRDYISIVLALPLAFASLFHFNMDERFDMWGIYFFAQFYTGVLVYHALARRELRAIFYAYTAVVAVALGWQWRWRLAGSLLAGWMVYIAGRVDRLADWPNSRILMYLGRTSYSLFLVHYPVLIVVTTIWMRMGWTSRPGAIAGLAIAYLASLVIADIFYRTVEAPTARLSHRWA